MRKATRRVKAAAKDKELAGNAQSGATGLLDNEEMDTEGTIRRLKGQAWQRPNR